VGSVVPFAGTAIGAVVGAGVGVALSASVEMAMLMAEEKLTRDDMKMDLLLAFKETLMTIAKRSAAVPQWARP